MYQENYDEMWKKFLAKEITKDEWIAFCFNVSDELMKENHEMLERLKNN